MAGARRLPENDRKPFRVGECLVDPMAHRVLKDSVQTHVEPRVMHLLLRLVERPGETVTREHLKSTVWPDCFVGEDALNSCVSKLRRALGDHGKNPRLIETIPKIGYRLLAPVILEGPEEPARTLLLHAGEGRGYHPPSTRPGKE